MSEEQLVFAHTVEAMFQNVLGDKLTEKARARLKNAGLDLKWQQSAYPQTKYHEWVRIAAEEVYPELPIQSALEKLGIAMLEGYEKTLLGRAVIAMGRIFGPKKTLARMTQNFRSSNNYMETRMTELGTNTYDLWINETSGCPGMFRGIMKGSMTIAGAKDVVVEMHPEPGSGACRYRISWS